MPLPDIAIINFSSIEDHEVQRVIRAVNRQITEDFMPIWGSGYICKLHASPFVADVPDRIKNDPVQAEAVVFLVDQPSLPGALGYHDLNTAETPVGFVFTDLGDWSVTLSHEVLELIVDPTVNILVPGPDPRQPNDPNAWLFHTYEVCDAVERTEYVIDEVRVSNFVTPAYFAEGDAPGTRNDFLGVGVDSFGVTEGSHLGTIDPETFDWVQILGNEFPSASTVKSRMRQYARDGTRPRASEKQDACLSEYKRKPAVGGMGLPHLSALTRSARKRDWFQRRGAKYRS